MNEPPRNAIAPVFARHLTIGPAECGASSPACAENHYLPTADSTHLPMRPTLKGGEGLSVAKIFDAASPPAPKPALRSARRFELSRGAGNVRHHRTRSVLATRDAGTHCPNCIAGGLGSQAVRTVARGLPLPGHALVSARELAAVTVREGRVMFSNFLTVVVLSVIILATVAHAAMVTMAIREDR